MKTIFLTILVYFFSVQFSQAQWQPDVRLTNDPGFSTTTHYSNARCIASSGDTVHVVWQDVRDGGNEIYYKRSTDGGISWGTDTRISHDNNISENPSISISGSNVFIVWDDDDEIYYNHSTDTGTSWGTDFRLTNDTLFSRYPSVSVSGLLVHVVWQNWEMLDIYYKRSTDGGLTWEAETRLTNDFAPSWYPAVSVYGSIIHVVWWDGRSGQSDVYYKRSEDGGGTWGTDFPLTNNITGYSDSPSLSVSGSDVQVVFRDIRDGDYGIYSKHSTDGGINWRIDTRVTEGISTILNPSVSVSGSVVHVLWMDNRDGNYEIYYNRSTDGGLSWGTDTRLTNDAAGSFYPFVSASGSAVHVVWLDLRDGNFEIYYKRDPTGNVTAIENIVSELPEAFNLEQNYPNPFNPSTSIQYTIGGRQFVSLKVYDVLGNEIANLVNEEKSAGSYEVNFDASRLSSGIYFYNLQAGNYVETMKMILIK